MRHARETRMALDQETAFRLLMSQRAMLLGYVLPIVRDRQHAEDVLQNVGLIVLKKHHQIPDEDAFPGWIRRTARWEAMNLCRKEKRAPGLFDDALLESLEEHWAAYDMRTNEENAQAMAALRECLDRLTPRSRMLLDCRYQQDMSGKDLSREFSRPVKTVYMALSRIHRTLGDCVRFKLGRGGGA